MFEVKSYDNFNELIEDTKIWLDQNCKKFPFIFRAYEDYDSETDWGSGESIEETIKYIKQAKFFHFGSSGKFVIARKKPIDDIDFENTVVLFAMLKLPKNNLEFIWKMQTMGEDFFAGQNSFMAIYDGRDAIISTIKHLIERDSVEFCMKKYEKKLHSLSEEKIVELYQTYERDCENFGEKLQPNRTSKCYANFIKNMMNV